MTEAFKILSRPEWEAAQAAGAFDGSEVDRRDGYIHLSTAAQLVETARRHFADRSDLVLLTVPLEPLGDAIRWEPSRGGDLFPHLYGPLPTSAVTDERAFSVSPEGEMRFADGGGAWA